MSLEELARLETVLNEVSQRSQFEAGCSDILRLILLTGCRISEVIGLKWSYVKGVEWQLPDSKTGAKVVHVGKSAQRLLKAHKRSATGKSRAMMCFLS
ncbi:hypothetical protein [Vibrio sp. ER1A]|uniref:hypothetical protein n=1 Tax=Vibrio sp. ER1A TaxID=1517681 RepID=UPI000690B49A|nr:hypothetical protein [Vibrio sp. ER1A]